MYLPKAKPYFVSDTIDKTPNTHTHIPSTPVCTGLKLFSFQFVFLLFGFQRSCYA